MGYVLIVLIIIVLVGIPVCILTDKKEYNNGVCPKCGTEYRHFATDSHGGRGYCCDGCNYVIWISWPVDRKRFK